MFQAQNRHPDGTTSQYASISAVFPYNLISENASLLGNFQTEYDSDSNSRFSADFCMFLRIKSLRIWRKTSEEISNEKQGLGRQKH